MKTDDLIALLATGVEPVPRHQPERRLGAATAVGLTGALAVVAAGYGLRPDLAHMAQWPMFWVKLAFPGLVALVSLALVLRVARPGMPLGAWRWLVGLPLLAMLALSTWALLGAEPGQRAPLLLGQTWQSCSLSIALVALPVLATSLWTLKGLAPTRLRLAGACAGLLAGSAGALVYALHCPELAAPFLTVWNGLGMALMAGVGALLGPRSLRW